MTDLVKVIGERIRQARGAAGLSVVALASQSGVARATLTQLEAGSGNPTLETLDALAGAVGVPLTHLVQPLGGGQGTEVLRRGEGPHAVGLAMQAVLLAHTRVAGVSADLYAIDIGAGARHDSSPHAAGTIEHAHIHSGTVRIGTSDDTVELQAGDYIRFDGALPHSYEAPAGPARFTLLMVTRDLPHMPLRAPGRAPRPADPVAPR